MALCHGHALSELDDVAATYERQAARWLKRLRSGGDPSIRSLRENALLFVASAGNLGLNGGTALASSPFAVAGLISPSDPSSSQYFARATNTLVAENLRYGVSASNVVSLGCLNPSSNTLGNISAIGSDVEAGFWNDERTFVFADGGTSLAAPQVSSLATQLWTIRPQLTSDQIVRRILGAAKVRAGCDRAVSNSIDAYEALLSLDETIVANTSPLAPVRQAIFDFNDDNVFDVTDVNQFGLAFRAAVANAPPDYGRSDLNGDGYTGGTKVAAFNLNANRDTSEKPIIESSLQVLVSPTSGMINPFNEASVSDLDILCYYIYSPLYTGDRDQATTLLNTGLPGCTHSPVVVTDGDFSAWSSFFNITDDIYVIGGAFNLSSGSAVRSTSGGNPGAFLGMDLTVVQGDAARVGGIKTDFTYNPAVSGAITSLTISANVQMSPIGASSWQLVVTQGGTRYYSYPVSGFSGSAWSTVSRANLQAMNFDTNPNSEPPLVTPDGNRPNFGITGAPIQFGFIVGNILTGGTPGVSSLSVTHGLDNFSLTINR